ncbi:MAG: TIGR04076 family protein, partial [Actinomycetia bacterium]|nr:TIGR04076 family protein [Actinomycetes bacterium]
MLDTFWTYYQGVDSKENKADLGRPMELYNLRVEVESINGRSVCGMSPGDYFEVTNSAEVRIPDGKHFCMYAIASVLPLLP